MAGMPGLLPAEITACPRCGKAPLSAGTGHWQCDGCKAQFPLLDGVPCLFAEPEATLGEWSGRLHLLLVQLDQHAQRLAAALDGKDLWEATRARLERLHVATREHRRLLGALLAPLVTSRHGASLETHLALRTRLPPDQGIASYYANAHRDWCWGDAENAASLAGLRQALAPGGPPGRTLVLGAGAGRLAWDLHQSLESPLTVALDFNPLLVLLLARIVRGDAVPLYEFPLSPRSLADQAVLRELRAPAPTRPGFVPLLADALRPPFAPASFDTVVTPWVTDILPEDPRVQARRINTLLAPGGRWLQFGSLNFSLADPALCLGAEELPALAASAGFAPPAIAEAEIPYMCSPASRHGRRERVLIFCAAKARELPAPERHRALPDWLVTGREPVPLLPAFQSQAASTRIHLFIMSLVDGRRTLKQMAELMEEQRLMTREEAEPAIRSFLVRMFDESQRAVALRG
jgi:hypothetical protein